MNKIKLSNPVRLIAFFLTAVILVCTFGFTVDGWKIFDNDKNQTSSNDNTPPPNNGVTPPNVDIPTDSLPEAELPLPEFYNRLTGLACDEATATKAHLAFVMNSDMPAYGLSYADLLCEIPIENGGSRYIAFVPNADNLWKVGSITYTRGYISNLARYFGAVCISSGSDDVKYYPQCDIKDSLLDLTKASGSHYTEFTNNVYTNRDLLLSAITKAGINRQSIPAPTLPYNFTEYNNTIEAGENSSSTSIKWSGAGLNGTAELKFDTQSAEYILYKNGMPLTDSINGKNLGFTNCFILFADSIKYDTTECNQMIMDTIGIGVGFYFSDGYAYSITWSATSDGNISFCDQNGSKLTVNRGRSYICYLKSSQMGLLSYE
ncbi:MAG: DUF3048 C-terminal domain-containing protein [Clostridia bacterium]|nr:DUF3048 C-terminal domain-containing protein [Clostridia bacterium]